MAVENVIYPGQAIGVIGNGISTQFLIMTAKKMGFKIGIYTPDESNPALNLADFKYIGSLTDKKTLQIFAERCDAIIYNSEDIDSDLIKFLYQFTFVPQNGELLDIMQDRLIERTFFETININMTPYVTIISLQDIYQSISSIGYPAILKPIQRNIPGSGELLIKNQADIVKASGLLATGTYILESYVEHDIDYSVVVGRSADGKSVVFPTIEVMYDPKLHQVANAFSPAKVDKNIDKEMKRIASEISKNINYVGTFEISFYVSTSGSIYVNKVSPTLSTAGFVFDFGLNVSETEENLRAVAGMPLTQPKSNLPTIFQIIRKKDYPRVQTQWVLKDNWHFNFYGNTEAKDEEAIGHILIPTDSISESLIQIEATKIWDELDYKSKYEKLE